MTRLIRVEVLRLYSRRLVRIVVPLLLLLVLVIVGIDALTSKKGNADEYAAFREMRLERYDEAAAEAEARGEEMFTSRQEIEDNPTSNCYLDDTCDLDYPDADPYFLDTRLPNFGTAVAVIVTLAAYLIGASAAGAEWSAGTMQSMLFWESRRVRVVIAKIIGLAVVVAVVAVAAEILFTLAAVIAAQLRGTSEGVNGDDWNSHLLLVLRGVGAACFSALLGYAIAFATRITAAAVGIGFIYFAVLEQIILFWKMWLAPYMITPLIAAWLNYGIDFEEESDISISGARAGITLAIYAAVMITAATVWFRQRDVT